MKKVVICGATGFIGEALSRRLLKVGIRVYGIGRNISKLQELRKLGDFIPVTASFEEYSFLHNIIDDRDMDVLWHLAWQGVSTSTNFGHEVQVQNVKAACDAAMAAFRLRCRICSCIGSYYQYSITNRGGSDKWNPLVYGVTKQSACDLFKALSYNNGVSCKNIIVPNVFGEGDKPDSAIVHFIKCLIENQPLDLVSGENLDDWIDIDDVIDGIICAALKGRDYVDYYVGHRHITTFKEKLLSMKDILCSDSTLHFGTYKETHRVDFAQINVETLNRDTGFEAKTDFAESILRTAEWIKRMCC